MQNLLALLQDILEAFQNFFRDIVFGNGNIALAVLVAAACVVIASRILRLGKL